METFNKNGKTGSKMARRSFLQYAGAGALAAGALTAASCRKTSYVTQTHVDLGSGDIGVLNYAYALEQLEAAFYTKVTSSFYTGATPDEQALLSDIHLHEVAHREFFKAALGSSAIPDLTPNFSSIDFTSRASVLGAAKAFEDTGVAAYNGAGYMIANADYLTLAGKIVSVEARHAALIRDLLSYNTFVDNTVLSIAEGTSLERSKTPAQVLPIANSYLSGKFLTYTALGIY